MKNKKDRPMVMTMDEVANKTHRLGSRRGFLKGVVVSGVALGATATAAKKVGDALFKEDLERRYEAEERMAEGALKGKKLVPMTSEEKEEMIKGFESGRT